MSYVKSFAFTEGDIRGDMFYIRHDSKSFTLIDCNLNVDKKRKEEIVAEVVRASKGKSIRRFILTHPDKDHYHGLADLWNVWTTSNVYMVKNEKPLDEADADAVQCKALRDSSGICWIKAGLKRTYLNRCPDDDEHGPSGINFLWPIPDNGKFKEVLKSVNTGASPNNISPAVRYDVENGASFLWMGDMETDMQEEFCRVCGSTLRPVDILFAPHHGRKSGRVPKQLMDILQPKIIVVGNAPSGDLDYSVAAKTITRNSAGDVLFAVEAGKVHVFSANAVDNIPTVLAPEERVPLSPSFSPGMVYLGTLTL